MATIRRRPYLATFPWPAGLAESSRQEGLWAAAVGDTAGAVAAYRRYLVWRAEPEPAKLAQRDSVRRGWPGWASSRSEWVLGSARAALRRDLGRAGYPTWNPRST